MSVPLRRFVIAMIVVVAGCLPALAQPYVAGCPTTFAVPCVAVQSGTGGSVPQSATAVQTLSTISVGTSSVQMDAAQTRRSYIMVHNPAASGGPVIGIAFGATPVLYAGGTFTVQPGQYVTWENSAVPNGALNAIASAAGSAITVMVLDQ